LDCGSKPHIESVEQRAAYETEGGVDHDREVEKAGQRWQQRDVTRQSLFGRWATTWRRTILPARDTVDWPTAALVPYRPMRRVFAIQDSTFCFAAAAMPDGFRKGGQ
jgi:hypothetical protein